MAPASAAERQHKPRERLKATGTYNHYKLRNVNYSRAYRIKKAKEFENLKTEDKEKLLKEHHAKANKRQSECRKNKAKPSYCCFSKQIRVLIQSRIKSSCQQD